MTAQVEQIVIITTDIKNCSICIHWDKAPPFYEWTACKLSTLFPNAPQWGGWLDIDSPKIPPGNPGETVCNYWEYCGQLNFKNKLSIRGSRTKEQVWTKRGKDD